MLIAGMQKLSLLDYPGQMCAVVFVPFCNMNCVYCHNYHILKAGTPLLDESYVLDYLGKRKDVLSAVVVTGGEPTLQQGLETFIYCVKEMGYLVKLDTNGTKPEVVKELMGKGLIDYVAMDIKANEAKYSAIADAKIDMSAIRRSIFLLMNGDVPYEFRTTFAPQLSREDILDAAELIKGTPAYYLQQYRKRNDSDPEPHVPSYVNETADAVREKLGVCVVRGL
ncbi:MAG TPA: anaerobic ribonucleoside-triphosphate reductase activating protein [Eubacteriales bacterium]|nr:anaerobic ribonucleoside-triphosphate reductase activating protein [Clostridia bacterium]HRV73476.1 anaerobic ribonucleoside-triphosphate reductase activating protein [Eubacteriales bacterium]